MLLPPEIRELIPEGHLVFGIDAVVEGLDVSFIYEKYRNDEGGRRGYHPKMLLKVLLYAYAIGVRSSRKIAAKLGSDVHFMYLAAMSRPDFRTISDFRKDHIGELEGIFRQVVLVCMKLGIAKVGHIAIDGTKMRASAGRRRTKSRKKLRELEEEIEREIRKILDEAERVDEEEDRLYGDKRGDEMPEELRDKEAFKEKIKKAVEKLEKEGWKEANTTDPDAKFMKDADGAIDLSYNTQIAVEGESQVIVANDVVQEGNDVHQFKPMYEKVKKVTGKEPEEVSADCGYYSGENMLYIEEEEIDVYLPDQTFEKEASEGIFEFDKSRFSYNEKEDTLTCPTGEKLVFKQNYKQKGIQSRIYVGERCEVCGRRVECTRGKVRHVKISDVDRLREKMRAKLLSEDGRSRYKKRFFTVEPVFGNLKKNLGYRDFLLRGLRKVKGEFNLMCMAHNLKKIHRHKLSEIEKKKNEFREILIDLGKRVRKSLFREEITVLA
jgi:transposase